MIAYLTSSEIRPYNGNMYTNVFLSLEDGKTGQLPASNEFDFKPFHRKDVEIELTWTLFNGKLSPRVQSVKLAK